MKFFFSFCRCLAVRLLFNFAISFLFPILLKEISQYLAIQIQLSFCKKGDYLLNDRNMGAFPGKRRYH